VFAEFAEVGVPARNEYRSTAKIDFAQLIELSHRRVTESPIWKSEQKFQVEQKTKLKIHFNSN
jgi:hypothetical protein